VRAENAKVAGLMQQTPNWAGILAQCPARGLEMGEAFAAKLKGIAVRPKHPGFPA
jgi:hypothetical protein